jgi:uncharacterized membrane-anchored protein
VGEISFIAQRLLQASPDALLVVDETVTSRSLAIDSAARLLNALLDISRLRPGAFSALPRPRSLRPWVGAYDPKLSNYSTPIRVSPDAGRCVMPDNLAVCLDCQGTAS